MQVITWTPSGSCNVRILYVSGDSQIACISPAQPCEWHYHLQPVHSQMCCHPDCFPSTNQPHCRRNETLHHLPVSHPLSLHFTHFNFLFIFCLSHLFLFFLWEHILAKAGLIDRHAIYSCSLLRPVTPPVHVSVSASVGGGVEKKKKSEEKRQITASFCRKHGRQQTCWHFHLRRRFVS